MGELSNHEIFPVLMHIAQYWVLLVYSNFALNWTSVQDLNRLQESFIRIFVRKFTFESGVPSIRRSSVNECFERNLDTEYYSPQFYTFTLHTYNHSYIHSIHFYILYKYNMAEFYTFTRDNNRVIFILIQFLNELFYKQLSTLIYSFYLMSWG